MKPTLQVLWSSFEEENLMDSCGSDFEVGVENGGENSPAVSLVEESDFSDIFANVSGGGEEGGSSAGEGSSHRRKQGERTRKKVVPREGGKVGQKAAGDGVVLGGNPLKEEKGRGVTVRGRCTLERLVTMNGRLIEYQKEAAKGCVLAPVMKYCSFAMERNLALALVKAWVP